MSIKGRFIRCMGSELDKPAVLEAARRFDFIHTGHYGWRRLCGYMPDQKHKAVVWFNPFCHSSYEGGVYDLQPSPEKVGHDKLPLNWSAEYGAYAYDWTAENWPWEFTAAVDAFVRANPLAQVLFDDWRRDHPWWTSMKPGTYARTIPSEDLWSRFPPMADYYNGDCEPGHRFWEMTGRDLWHTLEVFRKARAGDHIYCTVPSKWGVAQAIAALRGCYVGLGYPDGESMTDANGDFKGWLPKEEK